jgi:polyisoprenoid-binding protein YceI
LNIQVTKELAMVSTAPRTEHVTPVAERIPAGAWSLDRAASQVEFTARVLWGLLTVRGRFAGVDGTAEVDHDGLATARLTIDTASVDTTCARRDEHLRASDFFDAERHPTLTIAARQGVVSGSQALAASGQMTVLGRTQPVGIGGSLTVSLDGRRVEIEASTEVNRQAIGMGSGRRGIGERKVQARARLVFRHVAD